MKKWLYSTLAAIIITPIIATTWHNIQNIWAMSSRQEKYEEAYVRIQEFTQEQRMANEIQEKKYEAMKEDQDRQWQMIMKVLQNE